MNAIDAEGTLRNPRSRPRPAGRRSACGRPGEPAAAGTGEAEAQSTGAVSAATARAAREQITHAVTRIFAEVSGQRFESAARHLLAGPPVTVPAAPALLFSAEQAAAWGLDPLDPLDPLDGGYEA
ncbi:hypothetical protein GCM10009760_56260 [Kitasatospora kazusensis]|uniref:Uncharacterized protein n=1 Tax=Kitasatospora kazusensis TaxID=407974 RepID=A0ABN3A811_9ACTN